MSRLPQILKAKLPITIVVVIVVAAAVALLAEVNSAKGNNAAQLKMSSSGAPKSTLQVQTQSSSFTAGSGVNGGANNTSTGSPQSQPSTGQSGVQSTVPVQPVGKCTGCPTGSDPGDSATACPNATCTPPTLPQCPTCGGVRKTMTGDAIMCPMITCAQ